MNIAQIALEIALQAKPTWTSIATHTAGTSTLVDVSLARAKETFAGGTLWALGSTTPIVHHIQSHNNTQIILTAPAAVAITHYVASTIPFTEFLRVINAALSKEKEMVAENIAINTTVKPARYTLTAASDIRQVIIVPTDTTIPTYNHHYWREKQYTLIFYAHIPEIAGTIRTWYPRNISIKTLSTDTLPVNLRKEAFINNCLQLIYRMSIQKVGKDNPANYDLINEAKDTGDRSAMRGITAATTLWDYDMRYRA